MIRFLDAVLLAQTKLRTRKIRMGITVFVSSLLFAALVLVVIIANGAIQSVERFSDEGLSKRYIFQTYYNSESYPQMQEDRLRSDADLISRAKALREDRIKQKTAEAKKLNIPYDPKMDEPEVIEKIDGKEQLSEGIYATNPVLIQVYNEHYTKHPMQDTSEGMRKILDKYHPKQYFTSQMMNSMSMRLMKDGKEQFATEETLEEARQSRGFFDDPLKNLMVGVSEQTLVESFLLKKQSWSPEKRTIPLIIDYGSAEKLLALPPLKKEATTKDKLARISDIREKAGELVIETCYRDQLSQQKIDDIVRTDKEIAKNKANKDYKAPSLQYSLPDPASCGAPIVRVDKRTAEEKKIEANQQAFKKQFEPRQAKEPVQTKLRFQVVGLTRSMQLSAGGGVGEIALTLLSPTYGQGWTIPKHMYQKLQQADQHRDIINPDISKIPNALERYDAQGTIFHYVELSDVESAKKVNKEHGFSLFSSPGGGKLFMFQVGNSSIFIDELKQALLKAFLVVAAVISIISALIMVGTIGRTISDSRRETAVFRAIGAKRIDIALIYTTYTLLLSLLVAVVAFALGSAGALYLNHLFSPEMTVAVQYALASSDLDKTFSLISLQNKELLYVFGTILGTGILGLILPLLMNIRRNPINDMRDE